MRCRNVAAVAVLALVVAACGGSPITPPPPNPNPNPNPNPPANALPSIESITVQGRRARQPARFADLRETVDVTAAVSDAETPVGELTYQWSATTGTFSGTGRVVTWTAPDTAASTPTTVTITLKVIENYGHPGQAKSFSHEVTRTQTLALHDSVKEVGDMSVRFLTEFSKPQTNRDWQDIMRDFKASACAQPGLVELEREDVVRHYTFFTMIDYRVETPSVSVHFGDGCAFRDRPGDACAVVPVMWDSVDSRDGIRRATTGLDYIAAAYSTADARWWLCSSDYDAPTTVSGHAFYAK
jgi:hypothetical protein